MSLLEELNNAYPDATCELVYGTDFELLISVILSAQCTDKRVNIVTRELFRIADSPAEFCALETEKLESLIKSCGLYKNKAANIKAACKAIVERFGGIVPRTREELMSLPGVGRKTANVMLSVGYRGGYACVSSVAQIGIIGRKNSRSRGKRSLRGFRAFGVRQRAFFAYSSRQTLLQSAKSRLRELPRRYIL